MKNLPQRIYDTTGMCKHIFVLTRENVADKTEEEVFLPPLTEGQQYKKIHGRHVSGCIGVHNGYQCVLEGDFVDLTPIPRAKGQAGWSRG